MHTRAVFSLAPICLSVTFACASAPKPVDQLASSEAAVRTSEEVGAKKYPDAALEAQLAQDELQHGRDLMAHDDNDRAADQFARAKADAELAIALARKQQAQTDAKAAQDQLQSLQGQLR